MFSTFELSTFVSIVGTSFVGGYIICLALQEVFGIRTGKNSGRKS